SGQFRMCKPLRLRSSLFIRAFGPLMLTRVKTVLLKDRAAVFAATLSEKISLRRWESLCYREESTDRRTPRTRKKSHSLMKRWCESFSPPDLPLVNVSELMVLKPPKQSKLSE